MRFVCECFGAGIPLNLVRIIRIVYNAIRIGVPLILVLIGMIDLGKAISHSDEGEIKKAQQLLFKKFGAAALVFLLLSIVTFVVSIVDNNSEEDMGCVKCILIDDHSTIPGGETSVPGESVPPTSASNPRNQRVESIVFTANSTNVRTINIRVGETKEVNLNVFPVNATNKSVIFTASNYNVATFRGQLTSNGYRIIIVGQDEGTVKYTAVSASNSRATTYIIVNVVANDSPESTPIPPSSGESPRSFEASIFPNFSIVSGTDAVMIFIGPGSEAECKSVKLKNGSNYGISISGYSYSEEFKDCTVALLKESSPRIKSDYKNVNLEFTYKNLTYNLQVDILPPVSVALSTYDIRKNSTVEIGFSFDNSTIKQLNGDGTVTIVSNRTGNEYSTKIEFNGPASKITIAGYTDNKLILNTGDSEAGFYSILYAGNVVSLLQIVD